MKTKITTALFVAALAAGTASAQAPAGANRDAFLKQQAVAEMQRVSAQVDVLATNQEELSDRIRRTEAMKSEIENLRAEVAALKGAISELGRPARRYRPRPLEKNRHDSAACAEADAGARAEAASYGALLRIYRPVRRHAVAHLKGVRHDRPEDQGHERHEGRRLESRPEAQRPEGVKLLKAESRWFVLQQQLAPSPSPGWRLPRP